MNEEISALLNELWKLDTNRLRPGKDYIISTQVQAFFSGCVCVRVFVCVYVCVPYVRECACGGTLVPATSTLAVVYNLSKSKSLNVLRLHAFCNL